MKKLLYVVILALAIWAVWRLWQWRKAHPGQGWRDAFRALAPFGHASVDPPPAQTPGK